MKLLAKREISELSKMKMDRLVSADEHKNDSGPIKNWASDASEEHLLVILLGDEVPVGIVHYGGIDW